MERVTGQDERGTGSADWVGVFGDGARPPGVDPGPGGRPRLEDVAARAGVSLKQASRAINGEPGVARATSDRVALAARELGFRPNRLARSLARQGRSGLVGVLVPEIADASVARMVGAIEQVLASRDLALIVASHHDDALLQRDLATALIDRRVDALLLMSAPGSAGYLGGELAHGLVVVGLGRPLDGLAVDAVLAGVEGTSSERIGRTAAERALARLGGLQTPPRQLLAAAAVHPWESGSDAARGVGADVMAVME